MYIISGRSPVRRALQTSHMRSKLPSGGMKEMVRSFSKRVSRTHWWNLISSKSTLLFLVLRPWLSNRTCAGTEGCGQTPL